MENSKQKKKPQRNKKNTQKNHVQKKDNRKWIFLGVFVVVLCIVVFYKPKTTAGIEYIHEQEDKKVEQVAAKIERKRESELKRAIQNGNFDVFSMFDDFVFFGDSRTLGFETYGFLPPARVFAGGGYTINNLDDELETLKSLKPKNIYISYGVNDMGLGLGDKKNGYGKLYESQVKKVLKVCPDSEIYVLSIIPATPAATQSSPNWSNYGNYNAQLQSICKKNGWHYVDCTSLAQDGMADIYQEDGIHYLKEFYEVWAMQIIEATLEVNA